ncbi:hypothetical protein [Plebeiibacterium sediminum]|uniref:Uncharacterized protein n=1 Tax=Plebeiibacterium sediminum TaxID=2992112 RepID=A0AAE3M5P6_9BACT|nr:hypothetical protein [Plebeiobacterium sediminum]MCW3787736.1 hypothetical protein [Plebeiobacterium sediminum]
MPIKGWIYSYQNTELKIDEVKARNIWLIFQTYSLMCISSKPWGDTPSYDV